MQQIAQAPVAENLVLMPGKSLVPPPASLQKLAFQAANPPLRFVELLLKDPAPPTAIHC